jgi:hypothetical protein
VEACFRSLGQELSLRPPSASLLCDNVQAGMAAGGRQGGGQGFDECSMCSGCGELSVTGMGMSGWRCG